MTSNVFSTIFAVISTVSAYVFGAADIWIIGLVIMVIVDYVTGLMKAYVNGTLCSKTGLKGVLKKFMFFAIVAVATLIDNLVHAGGLLRIACIAFLISNEGISILENCDEAGIPVPQVLLKFLEKLKTKEISIDEDKIE